jgi:hypothetical protein
MRRMRRAVCRWDGKIRNGRRDKGRKEGMSNEDNFEYVKQSYR